MQKHTYEYVYKYFKDNGCRLLSKEYNGNCEKLKFICECGRHYEISFHNFKNGSRCMKCGEKKTAEVKKIDYSIIKKYISKNDLILLTIKEEYNGIKHKIDIMCKCGEEFTTTYDTLLRLKFKCCCECRKKLKQQETIALNIKEINNTYNLQVLNYRINGYKKYFTIQCDCGNEYETTMDNIKKAKCLGKCRSCFAKTIHDKKYTIEQVRDILNTEGWDLLSDKYNSADTVMSAICSNGHKTQFTMYRFMNGARCQQCFRESPKYKKENHWNWKGGISSESELFRKSQVYIDWRDSVYKRDNYVCQCCNNEKSNNLNAHHILNFSKYPELRLDIDNGITLCEKCHNYGENSFHNIYGRKNNTRDQLEEYINNYRKK